MKIPLGLAAVLLVLSPLPADSPAAAPGLSISTVRGSPGARPAPAPGWSWPLSPRPAVLRAFDPPARPWLSGHRGVDLAAAHDGAPLISPAAGTVSFVGVVVDRPVITIDHGNGLRSSFEPVASALTAGAAVAAGDVLGRVQTGHCGPAPPCLHWGVRRGEDYVNPLAFVMDLRPSVLLPPLGAVPG
ncbi:M23 family metallopeptidase [Arthrobacter sp. NPDC058130]|uniref:M23 family metallopeptidase n=1 Tax=Arthrobacter sp. NPDC058130 TaxID=3346353 RepID=UPI0036EE0E11